MLGLAPSLLLASTLFAIFPPPFFPLIGLFVMSSLLFPMVMEAIYPKCELLSDLVIGRYHTCLELALKRGVLTNKRVENNPVGEPKWHRGYTALHVAVLEGELESTKRLLAYGADVNRMTKRRKITRVEHRMIERFVDDNYHVNIVAFPIYGRTERSCPLHLACQKGDVNMIKLLLSNGADSTIKDSRGFRAFDLLPTDLKKDISMVSQLSPSLRVLAALKILENKDQYNLTNIPSDCIEWIEAMPTMLLFNRLRYGQLTFTSNEEESIPSLSPQPVLKF